MGPHECSTFSSATPYTCSGPWDTRGGTSLGGSICPSAAPSESEGGFPCTLIRLRLSASTIEDFDFTFQTSIRQQLLGSYLGPELDSEGRSVVFLGPTGTGKTPLAVAIAYRAIENGFAAVFSDADNLVENLSRAGESGSLRDMLPQ